MKALSNKDYVKLGIILLIGILIKLCVPVVHTLTPVGVTYLAIFVCTILCWTLLDTGWPTLLCMAAMIMFGVIPAQTVLTSTIANITVYTVMTASILVGKLNDFGVLQRLAKWFLCRKVVHGRPYVFMIFWGIVLFINGSILGTIIGFVLLLPLLRAVCAEIGCEKGSSFHKAMCLFTLWVGIWTEACLIFFMPTPLTGLGVLNGLGFSWELMDYMKTASLPVFIISIAVGLFMLKFVVKPDVSNFIKYDDAAKRAELKANPMPKKAKILTVLFVFSLFFQALAGNLPLGPVKEWATMVTMAGFSLFFVGILSVIRIDGEALADLSVDYNKCVPWKAIIFIGGTFLFSSTLSSAEFGIVSTLATVLAPVVGKLPVMLVVIIGGLLCVILTNLMSNVVTCFLVLSVFIPVLSAIGAPNNLVQATGALYIALCSLACVTPSGSPGIGLILGVEIENKGIMKYSIMFVLVSFVLMCLTVLPIGSILYK